MSVTDDRLLEALSRIAELARAAAAGDDSPDVEQYAGGTEPQPACVLKTLPTRLLVAAAETAIAINPLNAPGVGPVAAVGAEFQVTRLEAAVVASKYWGSTPRQLTVNFTESTPANLRARIVSHMNAWTLTGCISFVETQGTGDVRISREGGGYWSYLGTDITHIPRNRPTMNLQAFTMNTPESEYKRVIRHETGHTLGMPHEHMRQTLVARIDPAKAYAYFLRTQGWDRATVDAQVLTPLSEASLLSTPADQTSIMCYQLPGEITRDGRPIVGGLDINQTDYAFIGRIYPKPRRSRAQQEDAPEVGEGSYQTDDWDPSEDVRPER